MKFRNVIVTALVVLFILSSFFVGGVSAEKVITGADDLAGAKIGVQLGTTGDTYATTYEGDEAGTTIIRYAMGADAVQALKTNKIDCVIIDNITAENFVENDSELMILEDVFDVAEYAIGVKKGSGLIADINEALEKLKAEGTIEQILLNYIGDDAGTMPYIKKNVERPNGVLIMATNAEFPPYEYYEEGEIVGIDADIAQAICDKLGYELEIRDMSFDSIIPAILSGKADVGIAGMSVTDERLKDVDFTDSYASIKQVIIVRSNETTPSPTPTPTLDTSWYDADETEFVIYTADELAGFAVLVNNGTSFKDKIVSLGADVDLSGYPNWTPIGRIGSPFIGTFSGDGHVIYNLNIDYSEDLPYPDDCYIGLFGLGDSQVEISDVTLSNLTVVGDWYVGGIVGSLGDGNLTLRNCSIDNSSITGMTFVGGITGSFGWLNCSILDCTVSNSIIKGDTNIGGISGDIASGIVVKNCAVENSMIIGESCTGGISGYVAGDNILCYNLIHSSIVSSSNQVGGIAGSINQNSSIVSCVVVDSTIRGVYRDGSSDYLGGIVGNIDLDSYILNCTVTDSLITAEEDYDYVGGIAGSVAYNSTVSRCVVNGCTIGETSYLVGGIAGSVDSAGFIDNCAVEDSLISGDAYVGGVAGQVCENSTVSNCYAVGKISGNGSVGGIVGSLLLNGSIIDSVTFVKSYSSDGPIDYRIGSSNILESTLLNNYAWEGMTSNGVLFIGSDIGPNEKNGASVSSSEFWNNQSFFEDILGWDFENTWKMNYGNDKYHLPVLQFQETPVAGDATYLLNFEPNPTPTPTPTPDYNDCDSLLNLTSGWNFISVPKALDASNSTAAKLFGSIDTAGNAILGYNASSQSWEQVTADTVIKPLFGYWIYANTSTVVPLTYSDIPTTPGLKSLYPGWNAVGLSAEVDTAASSFFAGLKWRVALPWNCEKGVYDSAIVNGGSAVNSPDRLLSLGNGCWLYVEEANVLPGLTA